MPRHNANIDRVPSGGFNINDNERKVYIVHRTLGGAVGGWAGKVGRGLFGGFVIPNSVPDLAHHWAVKVGGWYHQLQANDGWNFYENDVYDQFKGAWDEYEVGSTNYNDVAIVSAAIQAINEMPESYHAINCNCQTFVLRTLDKICRSGRKKVRTSYSPFNPQIGFIPGQEQEETEVEAGKEVEVAYIADGAAHFAQLEKAQDIMEENTPTLTAEEVEQKIKEAEAQNGS